MSDDKPGTAMPPQPKTTELPAVPAWAAEIAKNVTFIRGNMETLTGEFRVLQGDVHSLQQWRLDEERRRLDATVPPAPVTSDRVRAVIDEHPSQMDLELKAAQAAQIVKDQERDRKIEETHALATKAATKDDVQKLADAAATKEEVKTAITEANKAQTKAILDALSEAAKNPLVRKIGAAAGVLVLQALALATAYLAMKGH